MNQNFHTSDWALQSRAGLLSSQLLKAGVLFVGCLFSVFIGMQIADPDTNGLAAFLRWLGGAAFLLSVISPKKGIYLVLLMSPVLDLLKRLLVIFTTIDYLDIVSVLALAPICMVGALIGTFGTRIAFGKRLFEPRERPVFFALLVALALITAGALHSGESKLQVLQALAESCSYIGLMLMVSIHFPTRDDVAHFFRLCLLVFLPVAIYGFWQRIFGFSNLEVRYMLSGLSISDKELYADIPRIYSTLNSNHSFSITMGLCALLALLQRRMDARTNWQALVKALGWVFFLCFSAASFVSLRRTGWLVILLAVGGSYCFQFKKLTLGFYVAVLGATALLIFNASFVALQLPHWEGVLQGWFGGSGDYALVLQTFNDRLYSFENLTGNPRLWTLFGLAPGTDPGGYVHDAISQTLVGYGLVGLLAAVAIIVVVLTASHRLVWRATAGERRYIAMLTSIVFSNIIVGVLLQSHIALFPINLIFWFSVGALMDAVVIGRDGDPLEAAGSEVAFTPVETESQQVYGRVDQPTATTGVRRN